MKKKNFESTPRINDMDRFTLGFLLSSSPHFNFKENGPFLCLGGMGGHTDPRFEACIARSTPIPTSIKPYRLGISRISNPKGAGEYNNTYFSGRCLLSLLQSKGNMNPLSRMLCFIATNLAHGTPSLMNSKLLTFCRGPHMMPL